MTFKPTNIRGTTPLNVSKMTLLMDKNEWISSATLQYIMVLKSSFKPVKVRDKMVDKIAATLLL